MVEYRVNAFVSTPRSERLLDLSAGNLPPQALSLRSQNELVMSCGEVLASVQFQLLSEDRAERAALGCAYVAAGAARLAPSSGSAAILSALAESHRKTPNRDIIRSGIDRSRALARNVPWPALERVRLSLRIWSAEDVRAPEISDMALLLSSDWGRGALAAIRMTEPDLLAHVAKAQDSVEPRHMRQFIRQVRAASRNLQP